MLWQTKRASKEEFFLGVVKIAVQAECGRLNSRVGHPTNPPRLDLDDRLL